MTFSLKNLLFVVLAVSLGSWAAYVWANQAFGAITVDQGASSGVYRTYDFFASTSPVAGLVSSTILATTTTATSTNITAFSDSTFGRYVTGAFDITGAKKVTFYFSRGDTSGQGNAGATTFKVQATRDGTTWFDVSRLLGVDVSATATSTVTITAATSTIVDGLDIKDQAYKQVRCIVVETTDGEHSCAASASF